VLLSSSFLSFLLLKDCHSFSAHIATCPDLFIIVEAELNRIGMGLIAGLIIGVVEFLITESIKVF
jgi:hypothetical protein